MSRIKLFAILLIPAVLLTFLAGCSRAPAGSAADESYFAPAMSEESAVTANDGIAYGESEAAFAPPAEMPQAEQVMQERLIIRTADMSVVVSDTDEALASIAAMAEENGGWVVNSGVYQAGEGLKTGNITIRVPAEGFQSALDAITLLSVEVTSLSTSGQDVTEEFVDLSARLDNLEATAARVRGFLDETRNVEEALAVNQELSRLEGEIEVIKGRMQYLSQSAAFSTISVNLTPDALSQPIQVAGWRPQGVARDALETLVDALQGLANVVIWLVIFVLPILLLIGIPVWLIVRAIRKRRTARNTPAA